MLILKTNPEAPWPDLLVSRLTNLFDYRSMTLDIKISFPETVMNFRALSSDNPLKFNIKTPEIRVRSKSYKIGQEALDLPACGIFMLHPMTQGYCFDEDSPTRASQRYQPTIIKIPDDKVFMFLGEDRPCRIYARSIYENMKKIYKSEMTTSLPSRIGRVAWENKLSHIIFYKSPELGLYYQFFGPWYRFEDFLISSPALIPAGLGEVFSISLYRNQELWIPLGPFSLLPPTFKRSYSEFSLLSPPKST